MRIAVNTRLLLKNRLEGIGWFTYETLKRITNWHREHEFIFIFDRPYDEEFIFSDNIVPVVVGPPARHPVLYYMWFEYSIPYILRKYKADVFLSPDGYNSLSTSVRTLPVIHDLNFIHHPEQLPWLTSKYYNYFTKKFVDKAFRIATVSEYSKNDIMKCFSVNEDNVDVVYNGANELYKPLDELEIKTIRDKHFGGSDYFIFIGALHPRKNIVRMLEAFEAFKEQHSCNTKLVIVGEIMFKGSQIVKIHSNMKHQGDVIFLGRLSPKELRDVLASALSLLYVPLFEGFGIPILEAMKSGVPVICSNVTSMPEVAGDAALYADPFDVESITKAMLRMEKDDKLRHKLISKGHDQSAKFNWDLTALGLWNSIMKCF